MAQPLDYRNPKHMEGQPDLGPAPPKRAPAVVPAEFDHLLTATEDHAAARAIEVELSRHGIEVFHLNPSERVRGVVRLHVRQADHEKATQIASEIFARRRRIKSLPAQEIQRDIPNLPDLPTFW
jgi:hypothetical protein